VSILSLILFGKWLDDVLKTAIKQRDKLLILVCSICLVVVAPLFSTIELIAASFSPVLLPGFSHHLERAKHIYVRPDQARAVEYIQKHVPKEERIFVGTSRHDRVLVGNVMFYFLADRHSGTKYHELFPGLTTTVPIQREIVSDLTRNKVNYIVLFSGRDRILEPNASRIATGVKLLDDFISTKYRLVQRYGDYIIMANVELRGRPGR
jgi:hypothetical protein